MEGNWEINYQVLLMILNQEDSSQDKHNNTSKYIPMLKSFVNKLEREDDMMMQHHRILDICVNYLEIFDYCIQWYFFLDICKILVDA